MIEINREGTLIRQIPQNTIFKKTSNNFNFSYGK